MIKILASDGMEKGAIAELQAKGCQVDCQFYEPDALCEAVKDYDVLVVRSATKVRTAQIDAAKAAGRLKLIIRGGVGVDNIDVKYAEENGITVRNTPRASSQSVAELALGHMFSCARFISVAGYSMREVIAYDIYHIEGIEEKLGIPYVEMDELLAKSDFISVHAPAVDGGAIINRDTIAKMKDGVCIINTSRGANLDEDALLEGLESGKVRAAGLDVYASEPAKNKALYSHPMVSCTPHIGASTGEAQKRIGAEIVSIISDKFGI